MMASSSPGPHGVSPFSSLTKLLPQWSDPKEGNEGSWFLLGLTASELCWLCCTLLMKAGENAKPACRVGRGEVKLLTVRAAWTFKKNKTDWQWHWKLCRVI